MLVYRRSNIIQHEIHIGESRSIWIHTRNNLVHDAKGREELIGDLQNRDVIKQITSPWSSIFVVHVKKKNGTLGLCVDYSKLNVITLYDSYPFPREATTLRGSSVYSTLQSGRNCLYHSLGAINISDDALWIVQYA